jgi:hypothetical protein
MSQPFSFPTLLLSFFPEPSSRKLLLLHWSPLEVALERGKELLPFGDGWNVKENGGCSFESI